MSLKSAFIASAKPTLTGRNTTHKTLGVLEANFTALLERRGGGTDYAAFQRTLENLNNQIQALRGGNADDLLSRGNKEIARQDMERFFDTFVARMTLHPQGIHAIAQVINPAINIATFETEPQTQFALPASQVSLNLLRTGQGNFDALRVAVERANNTDLFTLFSLFASSRAVYNQANNPVAGALNEDQIQALERQRNHLLRVNDELAGANRALENERLKAAGKTWASRAVAGVAGAAMAITLGGTKLPSFSPSAGANNSPSVNVTVNVGNTISFGHSAQQNANGTITVNPNNAGSTLINGVNFQMQNIEVSTDGNTITGTLRYQLPGQAIQEIPAKAGSTTLSNGKTIQLKKVGTKLSLTYDGNTVQY